MRDDEFLKNVLKSAIAEGCFPSGAAAVGRGRDVLALACEGNIYLPDGPAPTPDTLYDLASVTKLIAPAMIALRAVDDGVLRFDDEIGDFITNAHDKARVTIGMLMTHTAGFEPSFRIERYIEPGESAERAILRRPLAREPGAEPVYSCIGFILLGKILELIYGKPLDVISRERVFEPLGMLNTGYLPRGGVFVHEEEGRPVGVVHDENARFLGGISGNAGVFSSIMDMTRFAAMLSARGEGFISREIFDIAVINHTPGYDVHRGLGFHLGGTPFNFMGERFPPDSYGHTGFTGTSIAVDPHTGLYAVLLTNRIHPSRENTLLLPYRRRFHDIIYARYA